MGWRAYHAPLAVLWLWLVLSSAQAFLTARYHDDPGARAVVCMVSGVEAVFADRPALRLALREDLLRRESVFRNWAYEQSQYGDPVMARELAASGAYLFMEGTLLDREDVPVVVLVGAAEIVSPLMQVMGACMAQARPILPLFNASGHSVYQQWMQVSLQARTQPGIALRAGESATTRPRPFLLGAAQNRKQLTALLSAFPSMQRRSVRNAWKLPATAREGGGVLHKVACVTPSVRELLGMTAACVVTGSPPRLHDDSSQLRAHSSHHNSSSWQSHQHRSGTGQGHTDFGESDADYASWMRRLRRADGHLTPLPGTASRRHPHAGSRVGDVDFDSRPLSTQVGQRQVVRALSEDISNMQMRDDARHDDSPAEGDSRMPSLPQRRPAVFVLLGQPGLGKTMTASNLARELGVPFLQYNMGDFQSLHDINSLVGPATGLVGDGQWVEGMREACGHPRGGCRVVILLDEIEKAHEIFLTTTLLKPLGEGIVISKKNNEIIDVSQTIWVLTSNCLQYATSTLGYAFHQLNALQNHNSASPGEPEREPASQAPLEVSELYNDLVLRGYELSLWSDDTATNTDNVQQEDDVVPSPFLDLSWSESQFRQAQTVLYGLLERGNLSCQADLSSAQLLQVLGRSSWPAGFDLQTAPHRRAAQKAGDRGMRNPFARPALLSRLKQHRVMPFIPYTRGELVVIAEQCLRRMRQRVLLGRIRAERLLATLRTQLAADATVDGTTDLASVDRLLADPRLRGVRVGVDLRWERQLLAQRVVQWLENHGTPLSARSVVGALDADADDKLVYAALRQPATVLRVSRALNTPGVLDGLWQSRERVIWLDGLLVAATDDRRDTPPPAGMVSYEGISLFLAARDPDPQPASPDPSTSYNPQPQTTASSVAETSDPASDPHYEHHASATDSAQHELKDDATGNFVDTAAAATASAAAANSAANSAADDKASAAGQATDNALKGEEAASSLDTEIEPSEVESSVEEQHAQTQPDRAPDLDTHLEAHTETQPSVEADLDTHLEAHTETQPSVEADLDADTLEEVEADPHTANETHDEQDSQWTWQVWTLVKYACLVVLALFLLPKLAVALLPAVGAAFTVALSPLLSGLASLSWAAVLVYLLFGWQGLLWVAKKFTQALPYIVPVVKLLATNKWAWALIALIVGCRSCRSKRSTHQAPRGTGAHTTGGVPRVPSVGDKESNSVRPSDPSGAHQLHSTEGNRVHHRKGDQRVDNEQHSTEEKDAHLPQGATTDLIDAPAESRDAGTATSPSDSHPDLSTQQQDVVCADPDSNADDTGKAHESADTSPGLLDTTDTKQQHVPGGSGLRLSAGNGCGSPETNLGDRCNLVMVESDGKEVGATESGESESMWRVVDGILLPE